MALFPRLCVVYAGRWSVSQRRHRPATARANLHRGLSAHGAAARVAIRALSGAARLTTPGVRCAGVRSILRRSTPPRLRACVTAPHRAPLPSATRFAAASTRCLTRARDVVDRLGFARWSTAGRCASRRDRARVVRDVQGDVTSPRGLHFWRAIGRVDSTAGHRILWSRRSGRRGAAVRRTLGAWQKGCCLRGAADSLDAALLALR